MPRSRKAESVTEDRPGPRRPWLVQLLLPLLVGAVLLGGLLLLAHFAADALRQRGATRLAFADIDCDPPPGLSRSDFLTEVQYLASLPDELDLLDAGLTGRLHDAFASHPCVACVNSVTRHADGVSVALTYRVAVLALGDPPRTVDAAGILLPVSVSSRGLPVLTTPVRPPAGVPGKAWGDPRVGAAARVAGLLYPHLARVSLKKTTMDIAEGELIVLTPGRRILWGKPDRARDEARLKRLLAKPGGAEIDLRDVKP